MNQKELIGYVVTLRNIGEKDVLAILDDFKDRLTSVTTDKANAIEFISRNPKGQVKFDNILNINVGWMLSLLVEASYCTEVVRYLRDNGFLFKLESGEFIISCGSLKQANICAEKLSLELQEYLCLPPKNGNIEFARGVAGKFVGSREKYNTTEFVLGMSTFKGEKLCVEKLFDRLSTDYPCGFKIA
jgi:hypothetical protein